MVHGLIVPYGSQADQSEPLLVFEKLISAMPSAGAIPESPRETSSTLVAAPPPLMASEPGFAVVSSVMVSEAPIDSLPSPSRTCANTVLVPSPVARTQPTDGPTACQSLQAVPSVENRMSTALAEVVRPSVTPAEGVTDCPPLMLNADTLGYGVWSSYAPMSQVAMPLASPS